MGYGLRQCHTLHRQFAGGLPERNGGLGEPRLSEMMGQHLRLGSHDVGMAGLDHAGDLAVQLLSAALQQRVVGRVLHQRVLEGVDGVGRRATTKGESGFAQPRQSVIECACAMGATAAISS